MQEFDQKYPRQTATIAGQPFTYRYHKNPKAKATLVILTGGIGLSDLFHYHFSRFARRYSVLSFDYPTGHKGHEALADAIAGLLRHLGERAFLVGQSLGGFIAQIVAKRHPDVVAGLVLSNTGTLSVTLCAEAQRDLRGMLRLVDDASALVRVLPMGLVKRAMRETMMGKEELTWGEYETISDYCDQMAGTVTRDYELHMASLMQDLENHWNLEPADFERFRGRVLLLLSSDDDTFSPAVRQALIELMPGPVVVRDIRGGHLALLYDAKHFIRVVSDFVDGVTEKEAEAQGASASGAIT